jgi:hypothetical protein
MTCVAVGVPALVAALASFLVGRVPRLVPVVAAASLATQAAKS